ncbi:hypothetical protein [Streptomyces sp. UNOC14_S4]|uniref:hypothetical protein n=1 Tax=Streptomyces sp. UNOC14_S4 TaxID=2872340 RepID=UPI001E37AC18|nr:hypothetical protein [Streptomyces sp. UNOC14_S4]MCC3765997.1 hypothetical protein [Streptomyces sp. UNOC14_S4]
MIALDLNEAFSAWRDQLSSEASSGSPMYINDKTTAQQRVLQDLAQRRVEFSSLLEHVQWLRLIAARNKRYHSWWDECQAVLVPALRDQLIEGYRAYPDAEAKLREAYEEQRLILRDRRATILRSLHSLSGRWAEVAEQLGKSRAALGQEVDAVPSFDPFAEVVVPLPGHKIEHRTGIGHPAAWKPSGCQLLWVSHTDTAALATWFRELTAGAEESGIRLIIADVAGKLTGAATPRHLVTEMIDAAARPEITSELPWKPPTLLVLAGVSWQSMDDPLVRRVQELASQAANGAADFAVAILVSPKVWPELLPAPEPGQRPDRGTWGWAREAPLVVLGPPVEGLCLQISPYWAGEEPPEVQHDLYFGAWRDQDGLYGWFRRDPGITSSKKADKVRRLVDQEDKKLQDRVAGDEPAVSLPATEDARQEAPTSKQRGGKRKRPAPVVIPDDTTQMRELGLRQFLPAD